MSIDRTRLSIVKKVLALKDEAALENIHAFLAAEPAAPWGNLHPEVQASMERSLEQLDRGEGKSHAQVMAPYSKWLKPSVGRRKRKQGSTR
ncbi:MAG: hypothetical protein WAT74_15625 [Flavobacteriales bacterium]